MMRARAVRVLAVGAAAAALAACVLLDPPATLPIVPDLAPIILTSSVTPPEGVLVHWPDEFFIPVTVSDPAQSVKWLAFWDYSSLVDVTLSPWVAGPGPLQPGDGGVLYARIRSFGPPPGPGCHTVAIVIAYGFTGPTESTPNRARWCDSAVALRAFRKSRGVRPVRRRVARGRDLPRRRYERREVQRRGI